MGIEFDLFFVRGSKLTWFLCAGRKLIVISVGSIDLVFVWVVEIDLVFVCGSKITSFQCRRRN